MPIYTYTCDDCGRVHERQRPIAERNESGPCVDATCEGTLIRNIEVGTAIWLSTQWAVGPEWRRKSQE